MIKNNLDNVPIDLVYLWCDGSDKKWLDKKRDTLEKLTGQTINKDATNECRFIQSDELKYSLRSIEKYAPWVNKIFIVTDNQTPKWLNLKHPKIQIIDHKDIMPNDALPCFNSTAIESCLPYIEGLSEHFLFANDDMLIWNTVDKDFFYDSCGKPICRVRQKIQNKRYKHLYGYTVHKAYNMVKNKYKFKGAFFPHHNIDAYRKSYFIDCINEFKEEFDKTTYQQFREFESVQRSIITYYMLAKNLGEIKHIEKPWYNPFFKEESGYVKCLRKKLKKLNNSDYKLLCINDGNKTTDADREYMQELLIKKFPEKSNFEL